MTSRRTRRTSIALVGGLACTLAVSAPAQAKTWKASYTDPTGDGPAPGRDITEVKFRYKTNGSVLFAITLAGPIDPANADAAVGVSFGSTCKKVVFTGGGLFSDTTKTIAARVKGDKIGKPKQAEAAIKGNVYEYSVKTGVLKDLKAGCFAVALIDPASADADDPTVLDTTDEIKLKH